MSLKIGRHFMFLDIHVCAKMQSAFPFKRPNIVPNRTSLWNSSACISLKKARNVCSFPRQRHTLKTETVFFFINKGISGLGIKTSIDLPTDSGYTVLRVELTDYNGKTARAEYGKFEVAGEEDNFRLRQRWFVLGKCR